MTRDAEKKAIDFQKLVPSIVQWKEEEEGKKRVSSRTYTRWGSFLYYFLSPGKESLIKVRG